MGFGESDGKGSGKGNGKSGVKGNGKGNSKGGGKGNSKGSGKVKVWARTKRPAKQILGMVAKRNRKRQQREQQGHGGW
jgi:hypothetical protein